MSKNIESMKEKGLARLSQRELSGESNYQHVESDLPVVEGLRPLDEVLSSIREKIDNIAMRKRRILEELLYLMSNWAEYTDNDEMATFRGENGLYKFLHERVDQNISTSYSDVRICRMLASYRAAHLLKLDNRINALKRIAYLTDKRNPDRAEKERAKLLKELPQLSNNEVQERIDKFNEAKGAIAEVRRRPNRPWEMAISPDRGKIALKAMKPETVKLIDKLFRHLNEDRIRELVEHYQKADAPQQSLALG